jgi:hypothetical protein
MIIKFSTIVLLFTTVSIAQTVKPALPPLHATIVTQKKDAVKPAFQNTQEKISGDIWIPSLSIATISPCGNTFDAELGKDGKCHVDIPLFPAGWKCEIPTNPPDSGNPTVLRCTWEPKP